MQPGTKIALLGVLTGVLALLALSGIGIGALWIHGGTHPEPGTGSLGHVGITVVGGVFAFVGVVLGLFALYTGQRLRALRRRRDGLP